MRETRDWLNDPHTRQTLAARTRSSPERFREAETSLRFVGCAAGQREIRDQVLENRAPCRGIARAEDG